MFIRKRRYKRSDRGFYLGSRCRPNGAEYSEYLQICEAYRDDQGKPRQRVVCTISGECPLSVELQEAREGLQEAERPVPPTHPRIPTWTWRRRIPEIEARRLRDLRKYQDAITALEYALGKMGEWTPEGWDAEAYAAKRRDKEAWEAKLTAMLG